MGRKVRFAWGCVVVLGLLSIGCGGGDDTRETPNHDAGYTTDAGTGDGDTGDGNEDAGDGNEGAEDAGDAWTGSSVPGQASGKVYSEGYVMVSGFAYTDPNDANRYRTYKVVLSSFPTSCSMLADLDDFDYQSEGLVMLSCYIRDEAASNHPSVFLSGGLGGWSPGGLSDHRCTFTFSQRGSEIGEPVKGDLKLINRSTGDLLGEVSFDLTYCGERDTQKL